MTTIDTSRTIEIHHSPLKLAGLLVLSILMTAGGVAIAALTPENLPVGIAAGGFFGLCTVIIAWRLVASRGPAVILTPEGIRDVRVSADFVPWTAVEGIGTWEHEGQKIMVLTLAPEFQKTVAWTPVAKWTRSLNRLLGADGYCIAPTGLKTSYDALLTTASIYAEAARQGETLVATRKPTSST